MADWKKEIEAMRRRFDRVVERRGVRSVREAYDAAQTDAMREIHKHIQRQQGELITTRSANQLARLVQKQQVLATRALAGELLDVQEEAHLDSLRGLDRFVSRMEGGREILQERSAVETVRRAGRPQRERTAKKDLKDQATGITVALQDQLRKSVASERTHKDALRDVETATDAQFWRVERMVRTRASDAYNRAQLEGIVAVTENVRGVWARWVEHVDDTTWAPLDDRVAEDSMHLHGQVRHPSSEILFQMPVKGPKKFQGISWSHPPNRPNDRAIVMPWKKEWRIPAYVLRGGRVYWLVRR